MKEKSKKTLIIILVAIILILLGVIIYLIISKPKENIIETTNNEETSNNEEIVTKEDQEKKYSLTVYKYATDDYEVLTNSSELNEEDSDMKEAFKIPTETENAKVLDTAYDNYVLYSDKNIYLYNHSNNTTKKINLGSNNFKEIIIMENYDTDELVGICYVNGANEAGFYSLKSGKTLYHNRYKLSDTNSNCHYQVIGNNYLKYWDFVDKNNPLELLNSEQEKVEFSYNPADGNKNNYTLNATGDKNGYIYFIYNSNDDYAVKFYSNDLKPFYEGKVNENNYKIEIDNKIVYIANNDKIKKYNFSGELIKESTKPESTIKNIIDTSSNYILYTKNNKLILENIENNDESIELTKWSNEWTLYLFAYYTRKELDDLNEKNKKEGLYITINYEEKDSKGNYGIEYCYTNDKKVIEYQIKEEMGGRAKPVLYLYPTEKTNIKVTFEHPEYLTTTYPKYNSLWDVVAYPNGDLYDKDGKYYYALYWDEKRYSEVTFNEGFYVEAAYAINFLEEKLTTIGLNQRERNEFIMYWLPILEKNEKSIVYFELTKERESNNKLIINPTPDSLLRVNIHIKKVEQKTNIKEQKLNTFKRFGFTAVEWGGMTY